MDEVKKANLCWCAMSHAVETIQKLYGENYKWDNEEIKKQYYKALDVTVFFSELEDKLSGENHE